MRCRNQVLTRGHAPQNGRMPLHIAAHEGLPKLVKQLLEAGADIAAKDTVSGRSVGYGGLEVRTSRNFGES